MSQRQLRLSRFVLAFAFAALGAWALTKADYGMGAIFILFGVIWLLKGAAGENMATVLNRHSSRRP